MTGCVRLLWWLMVFMFSITSIVFADDDDSQQTASKVNTRGLTVVLAEKTQAIAGLQTTVLKSSYLATESSVIGKAITLQPLLALRHRYLVLLAERHQVLARLKQAEQNQQRQQDLFQHGITSKRSLQEQQLRWQSEKAAVEANAIQIKAITDETRLSWGDKLTAWALTTDASKFADFLSGHDVLLQISLPADRQLSAKATIFVEAFGRRNKASQARFISEVPQVEAALSGQSYYFQVRDRHIKPGMRIVAWLPEQSQQISGVVIPKSAAIWLLDQLFVYVKTDETTFTRQLISDYKVSPDGYFTATGFEGSEEVVTTGAQLLLSEEQRQQIPKEDDDD